MRVAVLFVLSCLATGAAAPLQSRIYRPDEPGLVPPKALHKEKPVYTLAAFAAGIEGNVRLETIIDSSGIPTRIRLIKSLDGKHGLDEAAAAALQKWKFSPATKDGIPVMVLCTVEITFLFRSEGPSVPQRKVYNRPKDVTSPPETLTAMPAAYTPAALAQRVEGVVVLEGTVEPDGTVSDFEVMTGIHPDLDDNAIRVFRAMRFKPALRKGKPVPYRVKVSFPFKLDKQRP